MGSGEKMSLEALNLLSKLAVYLGVPIAAYVSLLIARHAAKIIEDGNSHPLIFTERILFVAAGVVLIALGAISFGNQPTDYTTIAVSVGLALLIVPLMSNIKCWKLAFGLQATFAQMLLVTTAFATVWWLSFQAQQISWPALTTVRDYLSLITWPVIVLVAGIVFFPALNRILGNVESLEGFGAKMSFRRKEEIEEEVEVALVEDIQINSDGVEQEIHRLSRTVRTQEKRYTNVITAWGVLAKVITIIAVKYGGSNDRRFIRENVDLLLEKEILSKEISDETVRLFAKRNGFRRRTSSKITADEHRSYLNAAEELAKELQPLLVEALK